MSFLSFRVDCQTCSYMNVDFDVPADTRLIVNALNSSFTEGKKCELYGFAQQPMPHSGSTEDYGI